MHNYRTLDTLAQLALGVAILAATILALSTAFLTPALGWHVDTEPVYFGCTHFETFDQADTLCGVSVWTPFGDHDWSAFTTHPAG